ncbi:hypothetical protein [Sulfitobacter sp. R18_1]|uniref:hypothetical protein n=1 Tax=Sulfitobacter sp. R18_1 TaxID=2821104 RepID=UPI001ADD5A5B|nr:hypothetical protein [Sulfitobacter sp. R18_1]MBO9427920.1 hypothetical protein [Sulfitobacter sp. R18_1]
MPESKCPTCGHEPDGAVASTGSNSDRYLDMRIPEHHWPVFKMMFRQMNTKFGMMGLGDFANLLPGYEDKLPLDQSKLRYVDDVTFAYALLAMERGYRIETVIEPGGRADYNGVERVKVHAELTHPDKEKPIHLTISDCAYEDAAKYICEYLEEASERYAPLDDPQTGL